MDMNGKLKILTSMAVFGTVGIFVRFIPMASASIAFCRGVLGCLFLLILMTVMHERLCRETTSNHEPPDIL